MSQPIRVERFSGPEVRTFIPDLARLRIDVFRDFPYLYDGDLGYEERYLRTYTSSPRSVVVVASDGGAVIGAATGIPLADEPPAIRQPFVAAGIPIERVFYFGESVLRLAYRGRGLGVRFFEEREAHARALGGFAVTCFCGVQRPENHPRRPAGYAPLDAFWSKRGYRPRPDLKTTISWKDLDEEHESPKPMAFWMKDL